MSLSVDFNGTSVEFDESDVTEELSVINAYDSDVVVMGYDSDGIVYEAIGMMSCDELVEIYEDSILIHVVPEMAGEELELFEGEYLEWLVENNADDGSWVGR
jgi:hypothetical protein